MIRPFRNHALIIISLLGLAVLLEGSGADLWVAGVLYDWQGQYWVLREHFITETLFHKGARQLLVLFALGVLGLAIFSHWRLSIQHWQRPLWYLFACLISTPILVALGKSITHTDCPWDLQLFGGQFPYLHLFEQHPGTWRYGRCFPGGHSSGGFALVALYFFFREIKPAWQVKGLFVGLLVGSIFALTQQLRGAHFISHDVWSLVIALSVSTVYAHVFFMPQKVRSLAW